MNTFEYKLNRNTVNFRYAKGKSLMSGDEIHPFYEILYYIKGDAALLTESFEATLRENSLIIIPKEAYHKFKISDQNNYTRLVFNFSLSSELETVYRETLSEIKVIMPNNHIANILERIMGILSDGYYQDTQKNLLSSAFNMLLAELHAAKVCRQPAFRDSDQLISKCIDLIGRRFKTELSVNEIAAATGVSTSALHRCFKEHMGTSVYKYITEKRLIYAHRLINDGANPTKIYTECGYNDYPTFYKAYKNKFGISPSGNGDYYGKQN